MKKFCMLLMFVLSMAMASHHALAQEVTITLMPGWNWISYPNAEVLDVATALGDFVPMDGDRIQSKYTNSTYANGRWRGGVTHFMPGWGYMYYSSRSEDVEFVFAKTSYFSVTTVEPTEITAVSAVTGGTVDVPEGSHVFLQGVCWSTDSNPTIDDSHTSEEPAVGSFSSTMTGLSPNTFYYVRVYAVTDYGLAYGEELTFTTMSGIPEVNTAEVADITSNSAICGGTVTADGGLDITARGVCWSTDHNPTIEGSHTADGMGMGSFTSTMTNLTPNTTYYVRAYATNSYVTIYGGEVSFTTVQIPTYTISVSFNPTEGGTVSGEGSYQEGQSCTLTVTANAGYTFTNWTEDGEVVSTDNIYSFTVNGNRNLVANFFGSGDHGYVDLGLPSGLLWATCNVGATTPEDYGNYFAWGETQPKSYYDWSTYRYCNGNYDQLTRYCNDSNYGYNGFTDGLTILVPEDDAATANWGTDWRMPTREDWQELLNNTTGIWTTQNGVNGRLFTASNGNSLFLPAAGSWGGYWSRSLCGCPESAWLFTIDSYWGDLNGDYRFQGFSVRALRSSLPLPTYTISVSANPTEGGTVSGGGEYEYGSACTLTATSNEGYTFMYWSKNGNPVSYNANYSFTVTDRAIVVANFVIDEHEYVDLGLPSGILWATCNIGSNTPEEYGCYFAWGETQPKFTYDWSHYQYCRQVGEDDYKLTKYCSNASAGFIDNLTTLLPEDDAATVNWGEDWRMPTQEEWQELYNNTTCTWTIQNGVNGRLFTAANGNSLFLPAAGCRSINDHFDGDSYGYYWSSSLSTNSFSARIFDFDSDYYYMYNGSRYRGNSVRPVRSVQNSSFVINATAIPMEGGTAEGGGTYQEGQTCTVTATANAGYTFTNWTEDGEVVSSEATYSFIVDGNRNLVANFEVSSIGGHAYVDLGLPSGLLWATCNVGADLPEGYGDYFAWGETQPKNVYSWGVYQYSNGGNWDNPNLIKYCNNSSYGYNGFTDNLTTLLPEDDAATANWGNDWRMPTQAEWQELLDNTTVTVTQQNGVNGRLFTASNGNSLFLPAAGYRYSSSLKYAGSNGYYWSSSLDTSGTISAWVLYFNSGNYEMSGHGRYCGRSVRAVRLGQN